MKNKIKGLSLYFVVGIIATLTEWVMFYILSNLSVYYVFATVFAYIFSTFVNWLSGRLLVFKESKKGLFKELFEIYLASVVGLVLNLIIMWLLVDLFIVNKLLAKVIATTLVFSYNFLVRTLYIYK